MNTVCYKDNCSGCMLCKSVCSQNAIEIVDSIQSYNAVIDATKCIDCNVCRNMCPQNSPVKKVCALEWHQGWDKNESSRKRSSSGGVGMALVRHFIDEGGYVCSCVFKGGDFTFLITNDVEEAKQFSGSKYVKSDPKDIYIQIKDLLKKDKKVLFIGLPCQAAAVKRATMGISEDNLVVLDLICHGSPSPKLLDQFLGQYSMTLSSISEIAFRIKNKMQIVVDGKGIVCKGVTDRYTTAFLKGFTYTDNCYSCNYACVDRVSDITIGDSWGTQLEPSEARKGISLVIINSQKGKDLLDYSNVELRDVDKELAIRNNEQLSHPYRKTWKRDFFFNKLIPLSFNMRVFLLAPLYCIKQDAKHMMIRLNLIKESR